MDPGYFPREFEVISFPSTENIKDVLKGWPFKIAAKEKSGSLVCFCTSEFLFCICFLFHHKRRSNHLALFKA